jgi:hypothetical protein
VLRNRGSCQYDREDSRDAGFIEHRKLIEVVGGELTEFHCQSLNEFSPSNGGVQVWLDTTVWPTVMKSGPVGFSFALETTRS